MNYNVCIKFIYLLLLAPADLAILKMRTAKRERTHFCSVRAQALAQSYNTYRIYSRTENKCFITKTSETYISNMTLSA